MQTVAPSFREVAAFWLRWLPGAAMKRTITFAKNKQGLGWLAFATAVLGMGAYAWLSDSRSLADHAMEVALSGVLPAVALIAGYFFWQTLVIPAEMHASFMKRDILRRMERELISLHAAGAEILSKLRGSNWPPSSELIAEKDQWVRTVRAHLADKDGSPNSWTFKFDDTTGGGLSIVQDASLGMRRTLNQQSDEKFAAMQEMTSRLVAIADMIGFVGKTAMSATLVSEE